MKSVHRSHSRSCSIGRSLTPGGVKAQKPSDGYRHDNNSIISFLSFCIFIIIYHPRLLPIKFTHLWSMQALNLFSSIFEIHFLLSSIFGLNPKLTSAGEWNPNLSDRFNITVNLTFRINCLSFSLSPASQIRSFFLLIKVFQILFIYLRKKVHEKLGSKNNFVF